MSSPETRIWPIENQRQLIRATKSVVNAVLELTKFYPANPNDPYSPIRSFFVEDQVSNQGFVIDDILQLGHPSCKTESGVLIIHPIIKSESGRITDLSRRLELPRNPANVTEATVRYLRNIKPKDLNKLASQIQRSELKSIL